MIKINIDDVVTLKMWLQDNTVNKLAMDIDYLLSIHNLNVKLNRDEKIRLAMQYSEFLCGYDYNDDDLFEAQLVINKLHRILGYDWGAIENKIHEMNGFAKLVE